MAAEPQERLVSSPGPVRMGIELSKVAKSYGPVRAVRGIDLAVAPGQTVALLGPNGAGKTTTIDMILGLRRPDSGTVLVLGSSQAEAGAGPAGSAACSPGRVAARFPQGARAGQAGRVVLPAPAWRR